MTKRSWIKMALCLVLFASLFACNNTDSTTANAQPGKAAVSGLPMLVDVGADKCIPCIKMAPILDQLREDFAGRMEVRFVDVWKFKSEAAKYNVSTIPTQIFYGADGKELFRHIGFFSREEILGQWQKLGYDFAEVSAKKVSEQ